MSFQIPAALVGRRLIAADVEGNGASTPEIVEFAALPLDHAARAADMSVWLVRPRAPITAAVTRKVHGIRNSDVVGKPQWTEIAGEVSALLRGRILVAHNAFVERDILSEQLPDWCPSAVFDTLRLAKQVWPGLPDGYGLDALITHAGLTAPPGIGRRHRAGHDAWMTAELLVALVEESGLDWPDLVRVAALPTAKPTHILPAVQETLW